jgi:hypothetical protein
VLSPEEVKRILAMATSLKARVMLTLSYGCGLRAGEVVRLRVCDIDSAQMIIRVVQSKGRKDRHVMLPPEVLDLFGANRAENIATARAFLGVAPPATETQKEPDVTPDAPTVLPCPCPHCGGRMIVIEVFARGCEPKWRPASVRIDTS